MSFLLDLIMCEATREESLRALPVVQLVMQTHTGNVNAASHGTQYVPCLAAPLLGSSCWHTSFTHSFVVISRGCMCAFLLAGNQAQEQLTHPLTVSSP